MVIFCFRNIIRKIELVPEKRLEQLLTEISPKAAATFGGVGPCCGFSTQYACMCDFHGLPYRDEVAWVGSIFHLLIH